MRNAVPLFTATLLGILLSTLSLAVASLPSAQDQDTDKVRNFVEVFGYKREGDDSPKCTARIRVEYIAKITVKKQGGGPGRRFTSEEEIFHEYKISIKFEASNGKSIRTGPQVVRIKSGPDKKGVFTAAMREYLNDTKRRIQAQTLMDRKSVANVLEQNYR